MWATSSSTTKKNLDHLEHSEQVPGDGGDVLGETAGAVHGAHRGARSATTSRPSLLPTELHPAQIVLDAPQVHAHRAAVQNARRLHDGSGRLALEGEAQMAVDHA